MADPNLDAVLEGLLEPLTEDRLPAAEALRLLAAPASEARCEGGNAAGERRQCPACNH